MANGQTATISFNEQKLKTLIKEGGLFSRKHYTLKLCQGDLRGIQNRIIEQKEWTAPPITDKLNHSICFS